MGGRAPAAALRHDGRRRVLTKAALLAASTLLTLAVVDRLLCLVYPPFAIGGSILVPDAALGWKLRANHVVPQWGLRTNSSGFRGEEFRARETRPLAAFVGDSVTYGAAGQEHTFPRLFEQRTGWASYNFGVPYYGPLEYEKVLPLALRYGPRAVVVGLFVGNDVTDCAPPRRADLVAHELGGDRPPRGWSWSGIYRFLLFRGLIDWRRLGGPASEAAPPEPEARDRFTAMELSRVQVFRTGAYPERWGCLRECLLRMRDLRADLTLLVLPDQMQVDDALWARLTQKAGEPRQFDRMLPNRHLAELGREAGLSVIDATDALRASSEPTFIPWDSHPNRHGNRIIADLLAERLRR